MARRQQTHPASTYRSGSTSRSSYSSEGGRGRNQGRMNDFSYETRGHNPTEQYFDEQEMRGSESMGHNRPNDYYSGRGAYGQDRYQNASRRQEMDRFGGYNRDHENRYFDEDYEGNRGFNREYNMHNDYQNRGQHRGGNRSMYDEEHRAYNRNQPQRMGRDWAEDSDYYTQNHDYQNQHMNQGQYQGMGQNRGQHRDREEYRDYQRQNQNMSRQNSNGDENYNRSDWYDEGYHRGTPRGRGGSHYPDYY